MRRERGPSDDEAAARFLEGFLGKYVQSGAGQPAFVHRVAQRLLAELIRRGRR